MTFITARKRSLGHGNIFAPVCHSVHREGGGTWAGTPRQVHPLGRYLRAGTPPGQVSPGRYTPLAGTPPLGRYTTLAGTYPQAGTPLWPGTPPSQVHHPGQVHPLIRYTPEQVHPPGRYTPPGRYPPSRYTPREQCMLGDTGNKRAVRILLECILVLQK